MTGSRTLVGAMLVVGLVVGACGDGDPGIDEGAAEGENGSPAGGELGVGGSGTITWGDQTHEFDTVLCAEVGGGFTIQASAGQVSLTVAGEDPDDPMVSVGEDLQQFTSRPGRGDGEFSFDGSKASGDMEFTAASGDVRQGSFDLTCS